MKIKSLTGSIIKTSSGKETIEVNLNGITASVPIGVSTGKDEVKYLEPKLAIQRIQELNLADLSEEFLIKNKIYLGANITLAISIAMFRAQKKDFGGPAKRPKLLVNMIEGGQHANNNLKFQEYLIICDTIKQAKDIWKDLKSKYDCPLGLEGGLAGNFDNPIKILKQYNLPLGIDAAGVEPGDISDLYYIEDPKEFKLIENKLIVADDLTVTDAKKIKKFHKIINGVIIKPNQIGTVSETLAAVEMARKYDLKVIVSHRGQETRDSFIADLAYGIGADYFKLGTYQQAERKVKYDRLEEIYAQGSN